MNKKGYKKKKIQEKFFELMDMFIVLVVSWVYTYVKT